MKIKPTETAENKAGNRISRDGKQLLYDFNNTSKSNDKLRALFKKAGIESVRLIMPEPKIKRESGYSYHVLGLYFDDDQTVKLKITTNGDIYQVLINGKAFAIKEQLDHEKAVAEMANYLLANSSKYQKLKQKEKPPKDLPLTPRVNQEKKLADEIAQKKTDESKLDTEIAQLDSQITNVSNEIDALKNN